MSLPFAFGDSPFGVDYFGGSLIPGSLRVRAVTPGHYNGSYRDIGDVFDLLNANDFSDSTASMVPPGNPDYPLFGWMIGVPATAALFSWAAFGNSSPVNGTYQPNSVGVVNLSIPRYVV